MSYIDFGKGEFLLPMTDYYKKKIFHRNYNTGSLELDLMLLKEFDIDVYEEFNHNPTKFLEIAKKSIKETFQVSEDSELPRKIINFKIKNFDESHPKIGRAHV